MHNIIKITGISATGKTFFLNLCKKDNVLGEGYYIDVGREIAEELNLRRANSIEAFESCSLGILEEIIQNRQPAIMTNHIVFRINDKLTYYETIEDVAIPRGYIHIFSNPVDILKRRISNNMGNRIHKIEDLETISAHQNLERNVTYKLAKKYSVGFLNIYNDKEDVEENLAKVKEFVVMFLK